MIRPVFLILAVAWASNSASEVLPGFEFLEKGGFHRQEGFIPIWVNERGDKAFLELPNEPVEAVFVSSMQTGLGSNKVNIWRGRRGDTRFVRLERSGNNVLMLEPNLNFRAESERPAERAAVSEGFASAVIATLPIKAESKDAAYADVSDLAQTDVFGVRRILKKADQGDFELDEERSLLMRGRAKAFPENTTIDALLTFTSEKPGEEVTAVAVNPHEVTLVQRIELIQPPGPGFRPRKFHSRAGFWDFSYFDYAQPLNAPIEQKLIFRHRLEKRHPEREKSRPIKPIRFYLDPGVPEPIRSALLTGGLWWNEAFEAAGYENAFLIEPLPDSVDPADTRYNLVIWVHRASRGWSNGHIIADPRTGEIMRGIVALGSLRVRQDILIFESLLGEPANTKLATKVALNRLSQLAAHEIGHALGLAHNFAASDSGDRSVMDYPHPYITFVDGVVSFDNAYGSGLSSWDKLAIKYGYAEFSDEEAGLASVIAEMQELGLRFISDEDARRGGSASAYGHTWDNGTDVLKRFFELGEIRRAALAKFGSVVKTTPTSDAVERKLVPVYLLQRYQLEAIVKLIGGKSYEYRLTGEDLPRPTWVSGDQQRRAFQAILEYLAPENLDLNESAILELGPAPYGHRRTSENFTHGTGALFDIFAPARAAAQHASENLLHPDRLNRLVTQHAQSSTLLSLSEVLHAVSDGWLAPSDGNGRLAALSQEVAWVCLNELLRTYANENLNFVARTMVGDTLRKLAENDSTSFHREASVHVKRFLEKPEAESLPKRIKVPPGSPI